MRPQSFLRHIYVLYLYGVMMKLSLGMLKKIIKEEVESAMKSAVETDLPDPKETLKGMSIDQKLSWYSDLYKSRNLLRPRSEMQRDHELLDELILDLLEQPAAELPSHEEATEDELSQSQESDQDEFDDMPMHSGMGRRSATDDLEETKQAPTLRRKRHEIIGALKKKKKIKSPYAVYQANLKRGFDIPPVPPRGSEDDWEE